MLIIAITAIIYHCQHNRPWPKFFKAIPNDMLVSHKVGIENLTRQPGDKTEMQFYYSIGPKNGTSVAPPSKKSTEHGLTSLWYRQVSLSRVCVQFLAVCSLFRRLTDIFCWLTDRQRTLPTPGWTYIGVCMIMCTWSVREYSFHPLVACGPGYCYVIVRGQRSTYGCSRLRWLTVKFRFHCAPNKDIINI